ncbi:homocysteine S-methyltransferase 3-like [Senna tora]|uniref:Homocysteine S-methyltransferase 3-like n=1 Tax=Senna tora TaxID=362788 RepID=A0A834X4S5_9FABA|nr:homocysteine S-methyltransferase 3-like [Senna tora]
MGFENNNGGKVETSSFMRDFIDKCGGYAVHLDYLDAGANIIITASYQATIEGFEAKGYSREEAESALRRSVQVACEARQIYKDRCTKYSSHFITNNNATYIKRPILVAASVGSYGAYLADGSEYRGDYGEQVTVDTLKDFHRGRLRILADSAPDLIAFETIPNKLEAMAYAELLEEEGIEIPAWFSFSCKDEGSVVSGDSILECASIADTCKKVAAIGVNCTAPKYVQTLIASISKVTTKPVLVYPNSGETYDGESKQWEKSSGVGEEEEDFVSYISKWRDAGASLFGGCCRTTPYTIRSITKALSGKCSVADNRCYIE